MLVTERNRGTAGKRFLEYISLDLSASLPFTLYSKRNLKVKPTKF